MTAPGGGESKSPMHRIGRSAGGGGPRAVLLQHRVERLEEEVCVLLREDERRAELQDVVVGTVGAGEDPECWVAWGEEADLLLILNGCPVSCADREDVKEKGRRNLMISGHVVSGIEKAAGKE